MSIATKSYPKKTTRSGLEVSNRFSLLEQEEEEDEDSFESFEVVIRDIKFTSYFTTNNHTFARDDDGCKIKSMVNFIEYPVKKEENHSEMIDRLFQVANEECELTFKSPENVQTKRSCHLLLF